MKLFFIVWLNLMVLLAVVFTWTYLQRGTSTPVQMIVNNTSNNTLQPTSQQGAPSTFKSANITETPQTNFQTNTHSTTSVLVNPLPSPKTYSASKASIAPASPPTVSTPQTKKPVLSDAQKQARLALSVSKTRSALVNILCISSTGGVLHSISGSGIIINPQGVILTNAHIAQYLLIKDYPSVGDTSCTIRTGSPARNAYNASLMFISPAWITANPTTITQSAPTGTGEHDIALLAITSSATTQPLPTAFPFLSLATSTLKVNTPIVIGSYAAQFLSLNEIQSSLYPTIVYGQVQKIYTFASTTVDLVSLGGSAAAQEGSSGGGIVTATSVLAGTITTSTVTGPTQKRDLHALTASYIRRDYAQEMQQPLSTLLAGTPAYGVSEFAPKRKTLRSILVKTLSSKP